VLTILVRGHMNGASLNDTKWSLGVFFIYLPNILLFTLVLVDDKSMTRRIYSSYMMIKTIIQSIAIPILILRIENKFLFTRICGEEKDIDQGSEINSSTLYARNLGSLSVMASDESEVAQNSMVNSDLSNDSLNL